MKHADWGHAWVNILAGFSRWYCKRFHRAKLIQIPLPERGPAIIVANHQSGLDTLILAACAPRPIRYLIAAEYYHMRVFRHLFKAIGCIPVDRKVKPHQALRHALAALNDGEVLALFPFGGFHLPKDPEPSLKIGVSWLASKTNAPIYPIYLSGIRGLGSVFVGLFLRSRVTMTLHKEIYCDETNHLLVVPLLSKQLSNKENYPGIKKDF